MEQTFLTAIEIKNVRHLQEIVIPLSKEKRKHLILTGKNGSGKTSVIEALVKHLAFLVSSQYKSQDELVKNYQFFESELLKKSALELNEANYSEVKEKQKLLSFWKKQLENWKTGAISHCTSFIELREKYNDGKFIIACYGDKRRFEVETYKNIEKVDLKQQYDINEKPGQKLTKYLVDLKAMQAFSRETEKAKKIEEWFVRFESILRKLFDDSSLELRFDEETFQFTIHESGREPFDFNSMSSGYAAVLDIINDLIIRMEAQSKMRTYFDVEGIVLIDEVETHLHLDLQKKILPMLIELFPNIQFIISTHSPFILSSIDNVVIFDLEKKILVSDGMDNLPYEGIVEGYFGADRLSKELRDKFERYKKLVEKSELSDSEYAQIEELEYYLDEIPDYLASDICTEYSRLRLEFANRG